MSGRSDVTRVTVETVVTSHMIRRGGHRIRFSAGRSAQGTGADDLCVGSAAGESAPPAPLRSRGYKEVLDLAARCSRSELGSVATIVGPDEP